ncbi:peptidoglycan -binding protein [Siculibacillus lacustris]|uniref:Peptidoglycan-binding protein n=1 Tax=Siculibacillus lacustris TaxID=1549641 RepID=A0A4Q9VIQ0_9HYPH|nr:peptidoglycan -binding protein [Siculibacillus lacustris]TBW35118.1 peptidoglycan -binding protein [Siculibacillus lacustris]
MRSLRRRREGTIDYWPGFVDALSTLLLVIIFLLSVFMLSQFFLSREITGKDTALSKLNRQIAELTELLSLERAGKAEDDDQISQLRAGLTGAAEDRARLQAMLDRQRAGAGDSGAATAAAGAALDDERRLSREALARVELLNQQISALRRQIAALEQALDATESRDRESQTKIADLGKRLNLALAQRVQELQKYRSDFFGRLKEILGTRPDIRVVGDRFVFQSEVLFPVGSDQIDDAGRAAVDRLAAAVLDLEREIPPEVAWTLRIDGHTDARPISGGRFRSNWELSAARSIAVVRRLAEDGVSPRHLVAAGFGEFQPLEEGTSEEVHARNRRIEIRLTDR